MNVHFDVPKEGKYWIVLGLCDPDTSNVKVSGKAVIMNPYGHIPARMYGIIPFTKWVLLIYTALFLAWIIRCCWYRKELMSVHVMITVVVGTFLFDTVIRLLMLSNFNHEGVYDRKITMFSLFITSATHTVARCLIIMVAMGLGVSKASLGNASLNPELVTWLETACDAIVRSSQPQTLPVPQAYAPYFPTVKKPRLFHV